jgi:cyclase
MASAENTTGYAQRFRIEQLADGVYAAIVVGGSGALGNAGIVDLGDRTLVFDTFNTLAAAHELSAVAEQLTHRPATLVANSHWHGDHINGNQVFAPDADILATTRTRDLIATKGAAELEQDRVDVQPFMRRLEDLLANETDPTKRQLLAERVADTREYMAAMPALRLRLPNVTFDQRLVMHGSSRAAELLTLGGGHTESDAFLYLPAERIAFLGDLLFVAFHPWLQDGDPQVLVHILEQLETLDLQALVPGHGAVGTPADLAALDRLAREAVASGGSADQAAAFPIPAPYDTWAYPHFFQANMRFLYGRAAQSQ